MDAVSNKINTNLIGLVNQDKKSDFSIMGLGRNLNLNSIAQQQIDKVITSNSFNDTGQQPVAYRQEGQAGHGNLIIQDGVNIQGYIADVPDNFNVADSGANKRCKLINEGLPKEAKVCLGFDNQIPVEGDVDFVAVNDKWYKIRNGTAIVSQDEESNIAIAPKGASFSSYGISPNFDIDPNRGLKDNLAGSGNVVHEVNDNPLFWSSPPDSLEPAQYLNRLHNESGIGPLPVKPPAVPDTSI